MRGKTAKTTLFSRKNRVGKPYLCYDKAMRNGQTLVEYILVLVLLMAAATAAGFIVKALNRQHHRTEVILGSHYP
ncbi:MAG: hypothetical protein IJV69_03180 [Kiritimatiellae bacterium]|nr:hypothetical protein [Kiritimatiellia bacterium]